MALAWPMTAQLVGRGHAGRAAADDGDFLAAQLLGGLEGELVLVGGVADELFDGIDADEILDVVAVAAVLAGRRADAAHHGRERVGLGGAAEGVFFQLMAAGGFSMPRTICSQPRISSPDGQLPWQGGVRCT